MKSIIFIDDKTDYSIIYGNYAYLFHFSGFWKKVKNTGKKKDSDRDFGQLSCVFYCGSIACGWIKSIWHVRCCKKDTLTFNGGP